MYRFPRAFSCLLLFLSLAPLSLHAQSVVSIDPIPKPLRSNAFQIAVGRRHSPVFQAVGGYYLLSFTLTGPVRITIAAKEQGFWDKGVEVQPMRFGIRPHRTGSSIAFNIPGPGKYVITRPGDHFAGATMLFLFANAPEKPVSAAEPGLLYYAPGIHHENIDAHDGDRIYLAPGAVVFGSLNIWQVQNVHVFGRGTIVYDGPQNPNDDEGWMHKPNWHCIVMDNAHSIEIDGITCIVRSRTWQIQMRNSRNIGYYNIKVIGGSRNNANQDGMDWLGGGDTTVANSFLRAADDDFAFEGNWDGYSAEAMERPGEDVSNITIRDSVVSTSISNTMRVNWPHKHFNSYHVQMTDMDILHTGFGACGVPFAMFELWANPDGSGSHTGYLFRNIRLDDWYSLAGIYQSNPAVRDIQFRDIWALDSPAMVPSVFAGDIGDVSFHNVDLYGDAASSLADVPLILSGGAVPPTFAPGLVDASFTYPSGLLRPHRTIRFEAQGNPALHYQWLFGDGTSATGAQVRHVFPDSQGTLLDGSGRFRVLLHVTDDNGNQSWSSQSIVIANSEAEAVARQGSLAPEWLQSEMPDGGRRYDGYISVPADGGYTFTLLTSRAARMTLDGRWDFHSPAKQAQVCGSAGDAVQPIRLSAALQQGRHRMSISLEPGIENAVVGAASSGPLLYWEGPGLKSEQVPPSAISHDAR